MSAMLKGVDLIMISNAQIALNRLSLGYAPESVNWEAIREFRNVLSKICDDSDDSDAQKLLGEVLRESRGNHPGQRQTDKVVVIPKEVVAEFDLLINNRPLTWARAQRLYAFCYLFSKHMNGKQGSTPLNPQPVTV